MSARTFGFGVLQIVIIFIHSVFLEFTFLDSLPPKGLSYTKKSPPPPPKKNKKAKWAFLLAILTHPVPRLTIPYFYVTQHTNQRNEKCDRVTQYFEYCVTG